MQGVVHSYLEKGFRVFAVSRSSAKLDALKLQLVKSGSSVDHLIPVVGDFANAAQAHKVLDDVHRHGEFSHVVSILGFVDLIMKAASETTPEELIKNWEDSFFLNVRASNAFVPTLKKKANASFTVVSGGLAHGVFVPQAWAATVKNGLLNVWAMTLEAELKETSVHFNNVCIHFGVAPPGQELNQLGSKKLKMHVSCVFLKAIFSRFLLT